MLKKIAISAIIVLVALSQLNAQDSYGQTKTSRDIDVSVGDLMAWFDYMPTIYNTVKDQVLAESSAPLIVIPIKLRNISQNKKGDEATHIIKAYIVLYDSNDRPKGGFDVTFYLSGKNEEDRVQKSEVMMFAGNEYSGQARTVYGDTPKNWFLKPEPKPNMQIYAKIVIAIDGFETINFITKPVKVGVTY